HPDQHSWAAISRNAYGRAAGDHRRDALWEPHSSMQGYGPADGDAGERNLAGNTERVHKCDEVIDHVVDGERAAHLLRQSGSARVVAQDTPLRGELRRDEVPAFERPAHFVDQYERGRATAGQVVAERRAFDFGKAHARSPVGSSIGGATSGRQSGAKLSGAPVRLRRSVSPRPSSISRTTIPVGVISMTARSV